jgi:hypothetical protein
LKSINTGVKIPGTYSSLYHKTRHPIRPHPLLTATMVMGRDLVCGFAVVSHQIRPKQKAAAAAVAAAATAEALVIFSSYIKSTLLL